MVLEPSNQSLPQPDPLQADFDFLTDEIFNQATLSDYDMLQWQGWQTVVDGVIDRFCLHLIAHRQGLDLDQSMYVQLSNAHDQHLFPWDQ